MPRNLDLTAVRSFVATAEAGGVTRAAGLLHLTQSAVSMQIKRLEESLDCRLFDRGGRGFGLTNAGEQLLSHARKMLAINDDIFHRLTSKEFEGEITLGVPHDIVFPHIPEVLRRYAVEFPNMKVQLVSSFTSVLKEQFRRGEADLILTTEDELDAGGETLVRKRLEWLGAPDGAAWRARPLRLAFERRCIFRHGILRELDSAGIPWEMAIDSETARSVDATVSADLAVTARLEGTAPHYLQPIAHGGSLPGLTEMRVNLYLADQGQGPAAEGLGQLIRAAYANG
ncbi:Transcriptional regulator, LysR family protein [Oceanicola granulosus HTCC2516]|uniref:Transcriptional regulator, LysR family protein n=1 Tax=Oceanicola granulosus (strain ATCC BAA-861 / DSM 15982 / KCTC 12143 / HTCC2516) TaxID=314256 RepID=Q2CA14_OCEGH|nr:LysR family transcriptional regulator [Oceanicola granulosus]EAR49523.1 Transcriptional regulator, LysR family protein [Oceanicola granulosus HTCC2516]